MTDVTTGQGHDEAGLSAADEQLLRELTERARTGGLRLTGEGGLLGKLTKMVVEGALEGELDDHLGYEKNDLAGRNGGNSRNGHRAKTVLTDTGPVEITVPRDRDSSFEPRIVAKRQRRLTGVDEMVISLSAKGLTHGEIAAHLAEVYGADSRCAHAGPGRLARGSAADGDIGQPLHRGENVVTAGGHGFCHQQQVRSVHSDCQSFSRRGAREVGGPAAARTRCSAAGAAGRAGAA